MADTDESSQPSTPSKMHFTKYHALGNVYLVLDHRDWPHSLSEQQIQRICNRHFGLASDGVLYGPVPCRTEPYNAQETHEMLDPEHDCREQTPPHYVIKIYNQHGQQVTKSGNGLRIFARYLWDQLQALKDQSLTRVTANDVENEKNCCGIFNIDISGGTWSPSSTCKILDNGRSVSVEMGQVSFNSALIPVSGALRSVINEPITVQDRTFTYCGATIGNPHCVIIVERSTSELARNYGPALCRHPMFPQKANVLFVQVLDRNSLLLHIWERGSGYALASGSSSCAAAAVARKLGHVDEGDVRCHMTGGTLTVRLDSSYNTLLTGDVTRVGSGEVCAEIFSDL